jgi:hypothetical protein
MAHRPPDKSGAQMDQPKATISHPESTIERDLSRHILSASAVMIGVCTTLIGLVKVAKPHLGQGHVSEYAGLTALLFFLSALSSYLSIRYANANFAISRRFERIADAIFLGGLIAISIIAVFFAFEVI